MRKLLAVVVACVVGAAVGSTARADRVANGQHLVISGHPEATKLGLEVLRKGGTAADALVTV